MWWFDIDSLVYVARMDSQLCVVDVVFNVMARAAEKTVEREE